jgi:hypothetical protein
MPANYVLLEKVVVGEAGAASVTFNSIPQTGYTDLVIKYSSRDIRGSATQSGLLMSLNGLTTNFTTKAIEGAGSGTPASYSSSSGDVGTENSVSSTANTFTNGEIYIPNYRSSNFKSYSSESAMENNATTAYLDMYAGLWSNTAPITSIGLNTGGTFVQYSTFSLYGVAALGVTPTRAPKAAGGSIIQTDGTYWYHTFLYSGTFTPATALSCDYLVVAGGGGGSKGRAGGGGAGGLRSTVTATGGGGSLETALSLANGTGYTVTIGGGGTGGTSNVGTNGSNSVFSTITSVGGGAGGSANGGTGIGSSGGSGGGGAGNSGDKVGGAGTANQGFAGGTAKDSAPNYPGGGGGGAGAVGVNATTTVAGNGGAGVATTVSGSSVTYAGGGGGGSYQGGTAGTGQAGGGNGTTNDTAASAATANTGSGGGGGGYQTSGGNGGAGGSGIVIIRYLA